jgi:NitT/TauT family transport system substrate-binding protein
MKRSLAAIATLVVAAGVVAGCNSTPAADTPPAVVETNVTTLTIGALAVADYGPLFYASQKGLFTAEGLDVTVKTIQGGANAVPSLLSGDYQLTAINWTSYVSALAQDIPVRAVLPAAEGGPGVSGIVATPASGITKPKDLEGKTVAVNNLKAIAELSARVSMEEKGVDVSKVKFVEMPFPDMIPALGKGTVDAAWVIEPFLTASKSVSAAVVIDPFAGQLNKLPIGGWATTDDVAKKNPKTLDKFAAAMAKATTALSDDAAFRAFLPSFTALSAAQAANLALPTRSAKMDDSSLDSTKTIMKKYGWLDSDVDVKASLVYLRHAA